MVQQDVLELDVSVGNALAVAVLQSHQNLLEDPPSLFLLELLVDHVLQIAVQRASTDVLHHQVDVRVGFEGLYEFDDVWVVHLLEKNHLPPHRPLTVDVTELLFVVDFNSILLPIFTRSGHSNHSVSSFTDLPSKLVVLDSVNRLMSTSRLIYVSRARVISRVVVNEYKIVGLGI